MSIIKQEYDNMISAMGVDNLKIPIAGIKFYTTEEEISQEVLNFHPTKISLTSCQALRQTFLGDAVLLTKENIGCIAAAISFGIVDKNDNTPLNGSRVYTDIMKAQSTEELNFTPPTPNDFTQGYVYACKSENKPDFCLFGEEDSGRYKNRDIAKKAINEMAIVPSKNIKGVFFIPLEFEEKDITPDIIILSVKPVELARIVQAHQFSTGNRGTGSMGAVRAVCSDLIARPMVTKNMNITTYCLGARLIAQFGPDQMGIGLPFSQFKQIVQSMEESKTGYPFQLYPGVND